MLDEIERLRSANRSLGSELMTERSRVAELEDRLAIRALTSISVPAYSSMERQPERHWLIFFEDKDVPVELYNDRDMAHEAYRQRVDNWSCHLFEQRFYNRHALPEIEPRPMDQLERDVRTALDRIDLRHVEKHDEDTANELNWLIGRLPPTPKGVETGKKP